MKNTRCEQLMNDAFTVFDDLEKTDRFSDLMDFWICRVKQDGRKVNWVQDVLPTMDTMRYHVATSLKRLHTLEQAVNSETTGFGGWSEFSNERRTWFRSAASRHHRCLTLSWGQTSSISKWPLAKLFGLQTRLFIRMQINQPMLPPDELLGALSKVRFKYTNAEMLYYLLNVGYFGAKIYAGIVGNPDDGGYGWFVWEDVKITHSDECYGSTKVALLRVLEQTIGD